MKPEPTSPPNLASPTENTPQDYIPTDYEAMLHGLEEDYGLHNEKPQPRRCYHIPTVRVRGRTGYRCRGCGKPVCLKTIFLTEVELRLYDQWQEDEVRGR